MVKYNHYKNEFDHTNGLLKWASIDEQYCFSIVFQGNYSLKLRKVDDSDSYLECSEQ